MDNGKPKYETVESSSAENFSGRAWTAAELRRKSFKDLHTLWYVVLRERNLLATQLQELARVGGLADTTSNRQRKLRCRKTMARIKYVVNERRLAYEGAIDILVKQKESELAVERERMVELEEGTVVEGTKVGKDGAKGSTDQQTAAQMAAAGVFDTIPSESPALGEEEEPTKSKSGDTYVI